MEKHEKNTATRGPPSPAAGASTRASDTAAAALPATVVEDSMHADIGDHGAIIDSGCSKGMVSKKRLDNFKT
eukprot:7914082-Pyramimonas_sp.AAC.1